MKTLQKKLKKFGSRTCKPPVPEDMSLKRFGFVEFERRESAQAACAALDGVDGVAVLTKGEWERIDRRWKDLSRSPAVAQARRRRRNVAEAAAPKLGGSKIRPGSFAGKGGKK